MAQGMGGGQDSADPDGGPGAGFGGDEGNLGDSQDGQNAPSGSPTGGHPDNDPDNNPGVSTNQNAVEAEAATGFDFDNWGGIGIQGPSTNQQHPGSHPDQQSIQAAIDQENAVTGLYGAYDDSGYQAMKEAMHKAQNQAKNMAITGIDVETFDNPNYAAQAKAAATAAMSKALGMGVEEAIARTSTALHSMKQDNAINLSATTSPTAPLSAKDRSILGTPVHGPQAFGPYGTMATEDTDYDTTLDPMAVTSIDTESYDQVHAPTIQSPHALDVIEQENIAKALATNNISIEEARQRHRAIEARQWGKTALDAKTAWGVLDAQLKETETKTYFGINFEVPKMSKFAKEKALVAFRNQYGKQIEAYNKHYNYQAKQSKQEPGLINPAAMLAGLINPILGFAVRVGQKYGYNESPMETAIREAEIDAGIREADHSDGDYIKKKKKVPTSGSDYVMDVVNPTNPGVMDVVNPTLYNPEPQD
jgi:hypothetical protein